MIIQSQKKAAEALGITATALRNWLKEPGFPDCSGGYHLEGIRDWQQQHQRKGSRLSEANEQLTVALKAERLKREQFRTRREEIAIESLEGTLIPRKGVEQTAAVILSSLADLCEQFPDLVVTRLPVKYQAKMHKFLQDQLNQWRAQLASDLRGVSGKGKAEAK